VIEAVKAQLTGLPTPAMQVVPWTKIMSHLAERLNTLAPG